jgi:pyruvate kinase
MQEDGTHTYNHNAASSVTAEDEQFIKFAVEHNIDYVAVSFVGGPEDIKKCRSIIDHLGGKQMIIAKIERVHALDLLESIVAEADAVMVARGDLGNEVPLEQIPFVQEQIIQVSRKAGKSVIVATQMLLSMVENPTPTRAEVTDVSSAILQGADAVMLSEETAKGKYPVEAVIMMEKIVMEAEQHLSTKVHLNQLKSIRS